MKTCPYCSIPFSTKQRLVSHLTKAKKCYNIQSVGMPPILLELMGYINQGQTKSKKSNEINNSETKSIDKKQGENKSSNWQCTTCSKYFINEKNLERHISNQKCPRNKKSTDTEEIETIDKQDDEISDESSTSTPSRKEKNMFDVYLPRSRGTTVSGRMRSAKITLDDLSSGHKSEVIPTDSEPTIINHKGVRYIVKEDYTNYLTELTGSENETHKLLKGAIANKEKGLIDLLYKIYCEGRLKVDFPIDIIDLKTKSIRYKTPVDSILDDQYSYIKNVLTDNLICTYLKHNNYIMAKMSEALSAGQDDECDHSDFGTVQTYILSLSVDKIKDKIILGFLALINKKINSK